jgi:hypothetical protein
VQFGVSYFGVRDPRHARHDLDEIAAAGFTDVIHTFSEHDLRYHRGDVARLVTESRARGLGATLDPWGVGGLFGGEAYSELALTDLACRQVDASGRSVPAACPNAPATRDLLRRWTRAALELGPDRLFWDEPHFYLGALREGPRSPCCRCASCEQAWRRAGGDAPLPPEGDPDLGRFRVESLRRLLEIAIEEAAPASGVRHTLCLLPRGEYAGAGSDDWETFATLDGLDRLATDPYWMERPVIPAEFVRHHAAPLAALCHRTRRTLEVWIQGIRIAAGRERDIESAAAAAVECGAGSVAFWSFRGTERMSWLACADPDAAWAAMKNAVRAFANAG